MRNQEVNVWSNGLVVGYKGNFVDQVREIR